MTVVHFTYEPLTPPPVPVGDRSEQKKITVRFMSHPETELNPRLDLQPTADEVDAMRTVLGVYAMRTVLGAYYDQAVDQYLDSKNPGPSRERELYLAMLTLSLFVERWDEAQQSAPRAKRELWTETDPQSAFDRLS